MVRVHGRNVVPMSELRRGVREARPQKSSIAVREGMLEGKKEAHHKECPRYLEVVMLQVIDEK